MEVTSAALAVLAVALAWPVPLWLGRASWPSRSPAAALLLWQAIALAGGLSMIGALLTFGLAPYGDDLIGAGLALLATGFDAPVFFWHVIAACGAVFLGGHLLLNLALTVWRSEVQRRRHAQLVRLLSSPLPDNPGARLIDTPAPVAYCLPGPLTSVTVFSAGLVSLLSGDELQAVIEHEKAHVTQRHDIVLIAFRAWNASLPWFPIASRAERAVGRLVEMLADDQARRVVVPAVLGRAIVLVGATDAPEARPDWGRLTNDDLRARVIRLDRDAPLTRSATALVAAAAVALVLVPTVLILGPGVAGLL